jgi:hypothetical protein
MSDHALSMPADEGTAVATVPDGPAGSLLNFVAMALKDPSIDVAKLEALLRMQREIVADDAREQFNSAFIRLQGRLPRIKKNGTLEYPINKNDPDGPKRKISNFMRWEDVDAGIRPILEEEGFALTFNTEPRVGEGGGLIVTATVRHRAGHSQSASLPIPLDTSGGKNNIQGYGSALKYGQRYTACAALNIVAEGEDDDGVAAGNSPITDEECAELSRGLTETKSNLDAFLAFMGVGAIPDIQKRDLTRARNAINAKRKKAPTA